MPRRIACLLAWSRTTIRPLRPSHNPRLRMDPGLAVAKEVRHAAPADLWMGRVRTHVRAIVPAALALGVRTGHDLDARRAAGHPRLGGDEHDTQVVPETVQ